MNRQFRKPYKLVPTPTGARLHYLRQVERNAPYEPRHGVTANHCIRLGWVESVCRNHAGNIVPYKEVPQVDRILGDYQWVGQRLTDAGKAFLDLHMKNRS